MAGTKTFLSGITVGAGLAYFLDPERGSARREQLAERLGPLWDDARQALQSGAGASPVAKVMRYGARIGDLPGMGAVTLGPTGGFGFSGTGTSAVRLAGLVLGLYGLIRRGPVGVVLRTVATGMLARAAGHGVGVPGLGSDRRRAVDIQKTLYIDAPVEQVYAFWSNYENFPLFMSHVREVEDLSGGRSRWSVRGPGGVPIEWNATLTQQTPNEVIAWRSEAGSMLENAGMIRFTSSGAGTRVDLRLCYHPPVGGAGQAVAQLLGSDPRAKMNDDLGRMKALLEATTRSESHGKESQS
ncbi:MAG TPA: SRPBCC family protein [Gemmatimonadales bacterium]|nr:SRPBCC family protein [Gemmatimonadales bacterium]